MNLATGNIILSDAHVDLMTRRCSINIGTRDQHNWPSICRAIGCDVTPDRRRVRLFISAARSEKAVRNIAANGAVAVTFSRPSSHRTIQLKGTDAHLEPPESGDQKLRLSCVESFVAELSEIGYDASFAASVVHKADADNLVVVSFAPTAAFESTPGPQAGQPLPGLVK